MSKVKVLVDADLRSDLKLSFTLSGFVNEPRRSQSFTDLFLLKRAERVRKK